MPRSALGRPFWLLWSAFSGASLGDGVSYAAFPLLAFSLTGDARQVAFVATARILPFPLFGLPAGLILDRLDRRLVTAGAQLGRSLALGTLAALIFADRADIVVVSVMAFVVGVGEILTDGGVPALVRSAVASDRLEVANSRLSATQTVTNYLVGPPFGALLFTLDPSLPFWFCSACFAVGAVALLAVGGRHRPEAADRDEGLFVQVTAGLRYVWSHPVLRPLALTVAVFSMVSEAGYGVLVILAKERLGLDDVGFGLMLSVTAVVSVVMSFFVAPLVRRFGHAGSMRVSIVAFAASALVLGSTTVVFVAFLAQALEGIADPTWNVNTATVRQRLVPDEVFGRMMTAYLVVAWGFQPVGILAGGFIAEAWGPQWVYTISGVVVASLLVLARPMFARITEAMGTVVAHEP